MFADDDTEADADEYADADIDGEFDEETLEEYENVTYEPLDMDIDLEVTEDKKDDLKLF